MIKPASQIKPASNLDIISEAIEKAAKQGYHSLSLYKSDYHFGYSRLFQYSQKDLDKLKELGYKVELIYTEQFYKGILWWKQKWFSVDYHNISW